MATHRINIWHGLMPSANPGNAVYEPASINFGANDRYPHGVIRFLDTATKDTLAGLFRVPKNYVGAPKIIVAWATTVVSGNAVWNFDYTAVAKTAESLDPAADQEAVTVTTAAPGTARQSAESEMSLTAANLAVDDLVLFNFGLDGVNATIVADVFVFHLDFEYSDA